PSYRHTLLSLHKSLVDTPSITGTEGATGSFLVEYLTSRNYIAQLQFLPPHANTPPGAERFNVVAWPSPASRNPSPRVLVTSHIDVVPPHIPYHINSSDSTIDTADAYTLIGGRGSVDAKASVAAQIVAVESLLSSEAIAPEDVMLLFVVGEEKSGDGMLHFSSSLSKLDPPPRFAAAVFGEPTENKLACGHKGISVGRVKAKGKAGHSGYPWLGKSATEVLMRAVVKVLDTDLGSSERYGNTTVNVGTIAGGVAANVIPKEAEALLAVRIAVGNETTGSDIVRDAIQKVLDETDGEALSLEWPGGGYGPIECDCDVDGFETMVANYGTDLPHLKGDHVSYLYGPGTILVAHGDDEALQVRDLETAVEGYKTLIKHALEL
ncbi:hypothetical protein B0T17DRAFT_492601, partial [Bombardia bombarda]